MHISREGDLVTLINVFETKPEQQQEVIDQWIRFVEAVTDETRHDRGGAAQKHRRYPRRELCTVEIGRGH